MRPQAGCISGDNAFFMFILHSNYFKMVAKKKIYISRICVIIHFRVTSPHSMCTSLHKFASSLLGTVTKVWLYWIGHSLSLMTNYFNIG